MLRVIHFMFITAFI